MTKTKFEDRLYLGTWLQRTSLHLKEFYNFLHYKQGVAGLNPKKIMELWDKLAPDGVVFADEHNYETVKVVSRGVMITVTEDGVVRLEAAVKGSLEETRQKLESFYTNIFGPTFAYLFGHGAPLPRLLAELKTVFPLILVTNSEQNYPKLFEQGKDEAYHSVNSENLKIKFGHQLHLFVIANQPEDYSLNELLENIIFYREFEDQLARYLNLHRELWEEISRVRESKSLRYKDFPLVRQKLLEFQKTLSFVKARLAQMDDIIKARSTLLTPTLRKELEDLGYYRFDHLQSNQLYLSHLWEMTIEYANETLILLDSLFQENTQRELSTLKFITFITALTGFFGMNIAFPWEERWPATAAFSVLVVLLLVIGALLFYVLLKAFIYNRRFVIKQKS